MRNSKKPSRSEKEREEVLQARWICPEGTVPSREPVPKQDRWGAYARAEEKREEEGAAERNYLSL